MHSHTILVCPFFSGKISMLTTQYVETDKQQYQQWYTNPTLHKWKKLVEVAKLARVCYLIFVQLKRTQYLQQYIKVSVIMNVDYYKENQSGKCKKGNSEDIVVCGVTVSSMYCVSFPVCPMLLRRGLHVTDSRKLLAFYSYSKCDSRTKSARKLLEQK